MSVAGAEFLGKVSRLKEKESGTMLDTFHTRTLPNFIDLCFLGGGISMYSLPGIYIYLSLSLRPCTLSARLSSISPALSATLAPISLALSAMPDRKSVV